MLRSTSMPRLGPNLANMASVPIVPVTPPDLILASASPRRCELLRQAGVGFQVVPSDAPEVHDPQLTARELAQGNAYRKTRVVSERFRDCLVLGADTLVTLEGELFGKPADLEDARGMLRRLQGHTHQVITAVCLMHRQLEQTRVFAEFTDVTFKRLEDDDINRYLVSINPLDKAGSYAIQEGGDQLVREISGSYSNVVGLPMERLRWELAVWGIHCA
jgi:septum formation protein